MYFMVTTIVIAANRKSVTRQMLQLKKKLAVCRKNCGFMIASIIAYIPVLELVFQSDVNQRVLAVATFVAANSDQEISLLHPLLHAILQKVVKQNSFPCSACPLLFHFFSGRLLAFLETTLAIKVT